MCYLNNICFVCLSNKDKLNTVYHRETDNEIFKQVKYVLPELIILDSEIPVCICSPCHTTLLAFCTFKRNCLENYSRLTHYSKTLQGSKDTQNQSVSEFHVTAINCVQPVKQEQQQNNELSIEDKNEDRLLPSSGKEEPVSELEMKDESLESEDTEDRQLYQHFVKCETVFGEEEDSGSNNTNDNNGLDKDEANTNADTVSQVFECSVCIQVFSDKLTFDNHLRNHINNVTNMECLICKKKFSHKCYLNQHMKSHLGIKDYECSICKKSFSQSWNLKSHMKCHFGIKDYECAICNKKFSKKSHLNPHMKSHLGIKDFECLICKKKFSLMCNLKTHMKLHEGIKEYGCSVCEKKFSQSCHLRTHMKIHS